MTTHDLRSLDQQIKELRRSQEEQRAEGLGHSLRRIVSAVVGGYQFRDSRAKIDFQNIITAKVRFVGDELESEDGVEIDEYVKREYEKRPQIHPENTSPGDSTQGSTDSRPGPKTVDIDSIGAWSTPEELDEYRKAIVAQLPQPKSRR